MTDDNKEAVKSSVLAGVAYGAFSGAICLLHGVNFVLPTAAGFVIGLVMGLLTTWDFDDDNNAS